MGNSYSYKLALHELMIENRPNAAFSQMPVVRRLLPMACGKTAEKMPEIHRTFRTDTHMSFLEFLTLLALVQCLPPESLPVLQ